MKRIGKLAAVVMLSVAIALGMTGFTQAGRNVFAAKKITKTYKKIKKKKTVNYNKKTFKTFVIKYNTKRVKLYKVYYYKKTQATAAKAKKRFKIKSNTATKDEVITYTRKTKKEAYSVVLRDKVTKKKYTIIL